jgi:hypothetical protein
VLLSKPFPVTDAISLQIAVGRPRFRPSLRLFTNPVHLPQSFDFLADCDRPTPSDPWDIARQFCFEPCIDFQLIVLAHIPDLVFDLRDVHNDIRIGDQIAPCSESRRAKPKLSHAGRNFVRI